MEGEKQLITAYEEALVKLGVRKTAMSHPAWDVMMEFIEAQIDKAVEALSKGERVEHESGKLYAYRVIQKLWEVTGKQMGLLNVEKARAVKAMKSEGEQEG